MAAASVFTLGVIVGAIVSGAIFLTLLAWMVWMGWMGDL